MANKVIERVAEAIRDQQNLMGYDAHKFSQAALDAAGVIVLPEGAACELGDYVYDPTVSHKNICQVSILEYRDYLRKIDGVRIIHRNGKPVIMEEGE